MDKIKSRIQKAVENLQLAENEMSRCRILKKPVALDNDCKAMLSLASVLADRIEGQSTA